MASAIRLCKEGDSPGYFFVAHGLAAQGLAAWLLGLAALAFSDLAAFFSALGAQGFLAAQGFFAAHGLAWPKLKAGVSKNMEAKIAGRKPADFFPIKDPPF